MANQKCFLRDLKTDKNKIVPRGDAYNTKAENVNTLLKDFVKIKVLIRFHIISI